MRVFGTVRLFDSVAGFGFITPYGGGKDVVVYRTAVEAADMQLLHPGVRVSFEVKDDGRGGKEASRLKLA